MYTQSTAVKGLRLLVVDDDADTRQILNILFELEGAKVIAVASASEALEVISQFKPDILISDISLPDESGYSLLPKVRGLMAAQGKQIPAIALTGYAREEDRIYAFASGFQTHLCKPINLDELVSEVASLAECEPGICLTGELTSQGWR
ncbi:MULTISPECIES: response regulator [Cyanophyceae]|uniref:Histidine kinase n=1 Tax=Nodularia spumigena CENA596 TaxID=1819295 RepID=A0A166KH69_NODSP|nr:MULTISPECIES: response regulator [Cyanophyceae]MDB9355182.1 response regulator [Nodularia spumigena CS-587/03]KZL51118.1 histidine kinase [Nodularia spumigena CENA596]MDB9303301.1 response regulator [Nodularia spumigena CS-591/12]MDB9317050.1 response regulator [Nodularia spumigena CS-590/01A]MDB9320785.1 response regulator [Nodularia spumigena CS-591/07A]